MSNIQVSGVQRIKVGLVTAGNLNTYVTASAIDLPAIEESLSLELTYPTESPGHIREYRDDHPQEVLMPKSWKLEFELNMQTGWGDSATTVASGVTASAFCQVLQGVMGGEMSGVATTVTAGTVPGTGDFTVASTALRAGQIIALEDTDSVLHMREIASATAAHITLKVDLPFAPATAATVYPCATFYLDNYDADSVKNFQFRIQGLSGDNEYADDFILLGGQCLAPPTITLPNNGLPRIKYTVEGCNWYQTQDLSITGSTLGQVTVPNDWFVCADCEHLIPASGQVAYSSADHYVTELTIEPNFYYLKHESSGGTNGVAGYVMSGDHPKVSATFTEAFQVEDWHDYRNAKSNISYFYQVGSSLTNGAMLLSIPCAQITDWQRVDMNGIRGQRLAIKGMRDKYTAGTTGWTYPALARSPFRIAVTKALAVEH